MILRKIKPSILAFILVVFCFSCNTKTKENKAEPPAPLQEETKPNLPKTDVNLLTQIMGKEINEKQLHYVELAGIKEWPGVIPMVKRAIDSSGRYLIVDVDKGLPEYIQKLYVEVPKKLKDVFKGASFIEIQNSQVTGLRFQIRRVCIGGQCVNQTIPYSSGPIWHQCDSSGDCPSASNPNFCQYMSCSWKNQCLPTYSRLPCPEDTCKTNDDCGTEKKKKTCKVGFCINGPFGEGDSICVTSLVEIDEDKVCPPAGCNNDSDCKTNEDGNKFNNILDAISGGFNGSIEEEM